MELAFGLPAEIGAINKEKDALCSGVFDEAVGEGAGGEGFACASGHLDERARTGIAERFFKMGDGLDLAVPHTVGRQRMGEGQLSEAMAEGVGFR